MNYLLKKEAFADFIEGLATKTELIAPVAKDSITVYSRVKKASEIDLSKNTYYPAKEFYLPKKEELFSYKKGPMGTKIKVSYDSTPRVIFGMRMCDVTALRFVDKFYLHDKKDPYYEKRRENLTIIAYKCENEEENCFCSTFEHEDTGYDMFFEKVPEGFLVETATKKGKKLINKLFEKTVREINKQIPKSNKRADVKDINPEATVFDVYGKDCVHCCACNIVCPTCTCFDIHDEPNNDLKSGKRVRTWDFCQSTDYTKVAGGFVFRKESKGRFRHRLQCKFEYMKDEIGETTCTGCGRCITACYRGICDIPEIFHNMD